MDYGPWWQSVRTLCWPPFSYFCSPCSLAGVDLLLFLGISTVETEFGVRTMYEVFNLPDFNQFWNVS